MALQNHQSMDQHHPQQAGACANCWLLCMSYVCYLLNHISCESLKGQNPLTKRFGVTPDISMIQFPPEMVEN